MVRVGGYAVIVALVGALTVASAEVLLLDAFLEREEPEYGWFDSGAHLFGISGTHIRVINVTSLAWLNHTHISGKYGSVWTHQVAVVTPGKRPFKRTAVAMLTGRCNQESDKLSNTEEYLVLADLLAAAVNAVVIVVYQIPNCPVVFRSDPEKLERKEDGLIAWAWRQYMTNLDPKWLPRLPMTKAGMQAMRATEEYLKDKGEINGALNWVVSGASKRGWTSFIVGSARCRTCPRVVGIAPLVPIVPSLLAEVHRQYQSYGGFTFAFDDYKRAGLLPELDNAAFKQAMRLVDPMYYSSRLKSIPKLIVLTSDDEFMQFDWSNIWYDAVLGEKHLLILANSEHSLVTGIPELVPAFQEFVLQVDSQRTVIPIESTYDKSDGSITVAVKSPQRVKRVTMRYAHTLQSKLRDFRWVRLANTKNGECDFPGIKLKKPVYGGGNCIQPIVWLEKHLHEKEGVYRAVPPQPRDGKWVGYYIQVHYESGFQETTPGFVWPDTLPFADCNGRDCSDNLV